MPRWLCAILGHKHETRWYYYGGVIAQAYLLNCKRCGAEIK